MTDRMTDAEYTYLWGRRYDLKVRALMNRMYYQERQRIFEWREGAIKAASIVAGSFAFANVASPEIIKSCAATIAVLTTASLVFGFGNKARDSAKRTTEWIQLERDINAAGERDFTESQLDQWSARANEIESGEPAAHRLLLERCNERAVEALGGKLDRKLNALQRALPIFRIP
ncbi:hypothetical protein BJN34_12910 [Cupriavidus necator]|uniref:SMODS and SLOG-associating 2TM effector domain-containing protein n=1 Tax=Cupriavidus necator TaxID=106590 RepID=A0A1U9URA1_CUPNE|nr:hypothetical protein [Cupriavidus necator]AQV94781.1 hypothetical protein BJN34_12910 [Cupriavidus necator]